MTNIAIENCHFIVDLAIKDGASFHSFFVCLPEGNLELGKMIYQTYAQFLNAKLLPLVYLYRLAKPPNIYQPAGLLNIHDDWLVP